MTPTAARRPRSARALILALTIPSAVVGCDAAQDEADEIRTLGVSSLPPLDAEFGRVAGLTVGEDGSVFVLDALNRSLRAFDGDGALRWTFGTRGQGPGEFERPAALFSGPAGTLWIADMGTGRLTEVDREGALLQTYRVGGPPLFDPISIGFSLEGRLRAVGLDVSASLEEPGVVVVEYEISGEAVSPVDYEPVPSVAWPETYTHRSPDVTFMIPVPFSSQPLFGVDPSGRVYHAQTSRAAIQRLSSEGGIELAFGRELAPVALGLDERAAELDQNPDVAEMRELAGDAAIEELTSLIPDTRPLLEGLFFDDHDNVWVLQALPAGGSTSRPVDLYDAGGGLIGTLDLPLVANPRPQVRDGLIVGVVRDELDVETVVRFRISG